MEATVLLTGGVVRTAEVMDRMAAVMDLREADLGMAVVVIADKTFIPGEDIQSLPLPV